MRYLFMQITSRRAILFFYEVYIVCPRSFCSIQLTFFSVDYIASNGFHINRERERERERNSNIIHLLAWVHGYIQ